MEITSPTISARYVALILMCPPNVDVGGEGKEN
jgi:hypothetical protein